MCVCVCERERERARERERERESMCVFERARKREKERERETETETERERERERNRVSWCVIPSQPQRIISGLRETFIKRYIIERTNTAEIRPEEQNDNSVSCRENSWNEIQLKAP